MIIFKLLLVATAACAMKLAMPAALNITMAPSVTQNEAVQLPRSTVWVTPDHIMPLVDSPEKMLCMITSFWADHRVSIINGINYLNNRGQVVGQPPGPGACSRFSCAGDSGIYACSDNLYPIAVDVRTVANFSLAILNNMSCVNPTSYGDNSQGQAFSPHGWNTIVGQLIGGGRC